MVENLSRQVSVSDMAGDERRSVEHLLGRALHDDQQVYILAFKPGVVPDEITRRQSFASMQRTFAAAEQQAIAHSVTDDEIDAAVDEAMDRVRYGNT